MPDLALLLSLLQLAVKDRTQLALVNIALRHKLTVCTSAVGSSRPSSSTHALGDGCDAAVRWDTTTMDRPQPPKECA